jgi:hypothetical protein
MLCAGNTAAKRRCNHFRLYLAAAALIFAPSHLAVSYNNALALEPKFRNQTFFSGAEASLG